MNLYINFNTKHKLVPTRPLIDYDVVLMLEPLMLAGRARCLVFCATNRDRSPPHPITHRRRVAAPDCTRAPCPSASPLPAARLPVLTPSLRSRFLRLPGTTAGVIANQMSPSWFIVVVLVVTIGYGAKRTTMKGIRVWKKVTCPPAILPSLCHAAGGRQAPSMRSTADPQTWPYPRRERRPLATLQGTDRRVSSDCRVAEAVPAELVVGVEPSPPVWCTATLPRVPLQPRPRRASPRRSVATRLRTPSEGAARRRTRCR